VKDLLFRIVALVVLCLALLSLAALIWDVLADGAGRLSWDFIRGFASRRASQAEISLSVVRSANKHLSNVIEISSDFQTVSYNTVNDCD
jgi:hypothetical protein